MSTAVYPHLLKLYSASDVSLLFAWTTFGVAAASYLMCLRNRKRGLFPRNQHIIMQTISRGIWEYILIKHDMPRDVGPTS